MICVIGGTGTVGSALVSQLVKRDVPVRALTRSAAGRAVVERAGIEAAQGDLDRPESLDSAMAGCDRLFLLSPPHPAQVTRELAAIDTARRAGVRHVVAVSIMGADSAASVSLPVGTLRSITI